MTFRCDVLEEDLAACYEHVFSMPPLARKMRRPGWSILFLGLLVGVVVATGTRNWFAASSAVFLCSYFALAWRTTLFYSVLNAGEHQFEITDELFIVRTCNYESRIQLVSLHAIVETPSHFFVFFGQIESVAIPKRDLSSEVLEELRTLSEKMSARSSAPAILSRPLRRRWSILRVASMCVCLVACVITMFLAYAVSDSRYVEGPLLDPSLSLPSSVVLGETFTMTVTAANPHPDPVALGSIDIWESFLDGLQVVSVDPEPEELDDNGEYRSWLYEIAVEPGAAVDITFELKAMSEGRFTGDIDVCNADYDYNTVVADVLVTGAAVGQ